MSDLKVFKQLAAAEDLALGTDTQTQQRNGVDLEVTEIQHNTFPGRDTANSHPASAVQATEGDLQTLITQALNQTPTIVKNLTSFQTVVDITPLTATQFIKVTEAGVDVPFKVTGDNEITLITGISGARTIEVSRNTEGSKPAYLDDKFTESLVDTSRRKFIGKLYDVAGKSPWSDAPVNILGDSISHGANCFDAPRESWVSLLKRMLGCDVANTNYGFVSFNDLIGGGNYKDIATVTRVGSWSDKTEAAAQDSISGYYLSSGTVGDYIEIESPMVSNNCYIWFKGHASGPTLNIDVNGNNVGVLDTSALGDTAGWLKFGPYTLTDNGTGKVTVRITLNASGPVDLIGISYLDDVQGPQVNNLSQSGRQFEYLSSDIINRAATGARTLILALGANDYQDDSSEAAIIANADLVIAACNANNTKLIVADFVWYRKLNNFMRRELKRIADSVVGAVYLPFPDWLYTDPTLTPTSDYLINDLKILDDNIHPNKSGHKMIAESIASAMGVSTNGANDALTNWGKYWPLELINNTVNTFTTSQLITSVVTSGNMVTIRYYLDLDAALTAEIEVADIPAWAQASQTIEFVRRGGTGDVDEYLVRVNGGKLSLKNLGAVATTRFRGEITYAVDRIAKY